MKSKKFWYLILGLIVIALILAFKFAKPMLRSYFSDEFYVRSSEPVVGLIDMADSSKNTTSLSIKHCTVVWKNTARWFNKAPLEKAIHDSDVLITIETWLKGGAANDNILAAMLSGIFDKKIAELGALVSQSNHAIYIRWAPDMEVPVYVYPWQFQSPQQYIQAFNYFAKKIKSYAPHVKIVWGPAGYPGDTEYWPGNKEVDLVSISLGSASEYASDKYPIAKTIPEMLKRKLHRLRFINKPVLILGSWNIGKNNFNQNLLAEQAAFMNRYRTTIYSPENYVDSGKVKPAREQLKIGVFDFNKKMLDQPQITIEHIFTDLGEVERGDFENKFHEITKRHRDVILTLEPWRDTAHVADSNVCEKILAGKFDREFRKLFKILATTQQTVYLRFMHEMEIPIHRYAWQSQDPVTYINAYRYFMQFEGGPGKNVKKVWGPAGDRGSIDFWPGDDVVDFISIAIYGLADKNITDPNQQEEFNNIFNRKFYRMRFSDKPLFITEFGVKGSEQYQDQWLALAAKTINSNPSVFGISYFNLYDNPKAWGNIKAPDWSITPQSMKKFCSLLK